MGRSKEKEKEKAMALRVEDLPVPMSEENISPALARARAAPDARSGYGDGQAREAYRVLFRKHGVTPHESLIGDLIQTMHAQGKAGRFAHAMGDDLERLILLLQEIQKAGDWLVTEGPAWKCEQANNVSLLPRKVKLLVQDRDFWKNGADADKEAYQKVEKELGAHQEALSSLFEVFELGQEEREYFEEKYQSLLRKKGIKE